MQLPLNIVYDTDYTQTIKFGWYPIVSSAQWSVTTPWVKKSEGFFDRLAGLFVTKSTINTSPKTQWSTLTNPPQQTSALARSPLQDQIKALLELPDDQYKDSMLTSPLRKHIAAVQNEYLQTISDVKSHIAPSYREVKGGQISVSWLYGKNYYVQSYPSSIDMLWTRDMLWFHAKRDMSFFLFPEDDADIQSMLKTRATQLKAQINEANAKWMTIDTEVEVQYRDVEMIRQKLTTREERYFETGYYTTIYEQHPEKLVEECKKFEQKIAGFGVRLKPSTQRMDEWFVSTMPLCIDELGITRSTVTTSLGGSFPFISNDLITDSGILYGVNMHTGWLVIFDRFGSKLPNMNSVVLATSWAGKSFMVKLEVLRYLLNGINIMVIDPENEYKSLVEKVWWQYINIATSSNQFLNPFDIPPKIEDIEYGKGDLLRGQIMNLIGLIGILIWWLSALDEAVLDKALQATYSLRGITLQTDDYTGKTPPLMSDLLNVLEGMDGWDQMALRLSKFVTGTFGKVFNNYTNIDLNNQFTVFSIRDLEEALKTPAMYNILNFIWTKVRSQKMRRLLICDEARIMLQNDISANFLFGLIKRARKYWLGITTISQDIEDFIRSKYGKPIVSNSALQVLLKQSTTSIKWLNDLLGLSEAEQQRLVAAGVWEGLMFAGNQHIAMKVLASPYEKEFITTDVK